MNENSFRITALIILLLAILVGWLGWKNKEPEKVYVEKLVPVATPPPPAPPEPPSEKLSAFINEQADRIFADLEMNSKTERMQELVAVEDEIRFQWGQKEGAEKEAYRVAAKICEILKEAIEDREQHATRLSTLLENPPIDTMGAAPRYGKRPVDQEKLGLFRGGIESSWNEQLKKHRAVLQDGYKRLRSLEREAGISVAYELEKPGMRLGR